MPEHEYMTVSEVADRLRVSRMTVYRMVERGDLESIRVARSIRIVTESFQSYLLKGV